MNIFNSPPPKINKKNLIKWLKHNFVFLRNKKFSLIELSSERDKNFLIKITKNSKFVVKISNTSESINLLKMQDFIIDKLSKRKNIKNFIPNRIHKSILVFKDQFNRESFVRILKYIDGDMYANIKSNNCLEESIGYFLGDLSNELKNLGHSASFRKFLWDPSNIDWIKNKQKLFSGFKADIIKKNILEYNFFVKKNKHNLRYSLTHGDVNNYNLVIKNNKLVGLIDYGDMIYAPTINDLAIALAYVLMKKDDLFLSLKNVIINYNKKFPISLKEIYSLITLVKCRLTITVVMASIQRKKFPKNRYLSISEKDAWSLLIKLDKINTYFFIFLIRHLCNFPIIENYDKTINLIKKNSFNNILSFDINSVNKSVINLRSNKNISNTKIFSNKINSFLKKNDSNLGIGLYGQKRSIYKGNNFISLLNNKLKRNVHLGIDLFTTAGNYIFSPFDGKVCILNNNNIKYDYGPTIVLEHNLNKKIKFYTLYGHLSKSSLKNHFIGKIIKKGECFAEIGNYPKNGDWPPHLHFQIILHLMDEKYNFPGVCEEIFYSMWTKICPNPNLILKIPNSFFEKHENINKLIKKRKLLISKNYSISYKKPLQMVFAKNQYMYDYRGRKYLDCINNISHVGHSNSIVHEALIKQNEKLNTNTRYIYRIINDYAEKLLKTFPKKLDTIFFVCTGSEANDLAYRIAKTYTNSKDVIVMDNAYHGHTNSLIDLSPYKFKGKGGEGQKDHVHIAEMPDGIRGRWLYSNKFWVKNYTNQIKNLVDKIYDKKKSLACFFVEPILGCGGQIILPKNYLNNVFKIIKNQKALCIVDEVQTGFARVGNNFWAFEEHQIIPDIVTLGKPMGNGHPISAVITTKQIAKKFNNGMEYFNSFGGNPVSCSVGNAVLDIIKNEKLQLHAYKVGKYLLKLLNKIQKKHNNLISEVRGRGLFLGIDIIKQNFDFPNPKLANFIINEMKNKGILLSTDGPYNNVIKIKPPMTFNYDDCDFLAYELEKTINNCN